MMKIMRIIATFYLVSTLTVLSFGGSGGRFEPNAVDALPSTSLLTIDPKIIGEWKRNGKNEYFKYQSNSQMFFGTKNIPYALQNSGETLVINSISTYQRIGTNTASLVGHWRDDANGEELVYRADGRYSALGDSSTVGYFGTYSVANSQLSSFEFRWLYDTDNGNLITHMHNVFNPISTPYAITNGDQTLTIGTGGTAVVYTRQ